MLVTKKLVSAKKQRSYGFLIWKEDQYTKQQEIRGFLSIGRGSSNQLILNDNYISRHHARIEYKKDDGFFVLKDMNSRNGCFLNGTRVYQAVLSHNDRIKLGDRVFTFSFDRHNTKWQLATQSSNIAWNEKLTRLPYISQNNYPVLLLGSSGTGKEIIAQLIHKNSTRSQSPMVSINCGAMTESLIESELFGHVKGSYTGAISDRQGAFLAAKHGSLFLDEIGELPLHLQPKLLRAIEMQEIKPVGSDQTLKTDVRIIAATHQNLKEKVEKKEFREDLYYRLNVVNIELPDLKNRMEDFDNFLNIFSAEEGVIFSEKARQQLKTHTWPGNIRELKNTVSRAKALFRNNVISPKDIKALLDTGENHTSRFESKKEMTLKEIEQSIIVKLLKNIKAPQTSVAKELGIARSSLNDRLSRYKIDAKKFKSSQLA